MQIRTVIILKLLLLWQGIALTEQQLDIPRSPCPRLFQYKYNGNDWYGELELPSPPIQPGEIILTLILTLRAATTPNNVGEIQIAHTPQEATRRIIAREPLIFQVRFPFSRGPVPRLASVVYHNNLLCSGPEDQPNSQTVVSRIELKHVMNTYTTFQPTSLNNPVDQHIGHGGGQHFGPPNTFDPPTSVDYNYNNNNNNVYQTPPQHTNSDPWPPMMVPSPPIPEYRPPPRPTTTTTTTTTTTRRPYIPPSTQPPPRPTPPPSPPTLPPLPPASHGLNNLNEVCGTRFSQSEISPFIFGGENTQRGDWPWMAAIYLNKPTGLSFNCGGTLISSRTAITAAHCINTSTKNYRPHEVVAYLGRYSLVDWSEVGSVAANIDEIIIHSDYKRQRESFDADIAILILTKSIEFTQYVRPICLWPSGSTYQEIDGKKGTVVGWGKDGTDRIVSNVPKKIDLPIVDTITCIQTSESLSKAVSNRTFCAGTLDGDGPCHGDSGGGLTLYRNGRWTLRGIVSAGLSDANTGACKLKEYVLFTDVALFSTWIERHIEY